MTWINVLERVNYKKASQEQLLKSSNDLIMELERILEIKERNKDNEELQKFHTNREKLFQMRRIFNSMVTELSGWATDYEVSNLINNYNTLEKKVNLIL